MSAPASPRKPALVRVVPGAAILLVFVIFVEHYIGWVQLLMPWREQSLPVLLMLVLSTLLTYWLRALRLFDYFRHYNGMGMASCLKLTLLHNLLNNLLPMRSGELSFPVLMGRYYGMTLGQSVAALLWFRVLDLLVLAVIAAVALAWYWQQTVLATIAVVIASILLGVSACYGHIWRGRMAAARWSVLARLASGLPETPAESWRSIGWTVLNWLVKLGVFAWVLGLFITAAPAALWLGAIAGDLTSVLPVHGVAGAGTYEAGVVAGLALFQVPVKVALAAAVNLHLFLLASTLLGGVLSLVLPGRSQHG